MGNFCDQAAKAVQTRLRELKWYQGQIDGQFGSMSYNALSMFKREVGLNPRQFLGPITLGKMFP